MFKQDWDDNAPTGWWPVSRVEGGLHIPSPLELFMSQLHAFLRDALLRRTRAQLRELTDEQLMDIGVTRNGAEREARRSFHLD